jgi:dienelactone hydrolase
MPAAYDPFVGGPFAVGTRTFHADDETRGRRFPCEIWYPEKTGTWPLAIYSHPSGGHRRTATYLCTHLSSHGYVVAALDHSETIAPELLRKAGETEAEKAARWAALMANRVPDLRFLLDRALDRAPLDAGTWIDRDRIGAVGHSLGGWTVLAALDVERRIGSVVALAPGGASQRKPGMLPATLDFRWRREVPALYLVAEDDTSLPLAGMYELFGRTPATAKRMAILRRADHMHFMDRVEEMHEMVRGMPMSGELAWLAKEMRPISELCSGDDAHLFSRGLALAHLDATLGQRDEAQRFMAGDVQAVLAARGVAAVFHAGR